MTRQALAARIENGVVTDVIVIPDFSEDDNAITAYCNDNGMDGTWIATAEDGSMRGQRASVGDLYDDSTDIFSSPPESHPVEPPAQAV